MGLSSAIKNFESCCAVRVSKATGGERETLHGSRKTDPGTCKIFRKEHRRRHKKCHHPGIKDHPRNEMVRGRASERPYRKGVCPTLSGHLASWIPLEEWFSRGTRKRVMVGAIVLLF